MQSFNHTLTDRGLFDIRFYLYWYQTLRKAWKLNWHFQLTWMPLALQMIVVVLFGGWCNKICFEFSYNCAIWRCETHASDSYNCRQALPLLTCINWDYGLESYYIHSVILQRRKDTVYDVNHTWGPSTTYIILYECPWGNFITRTLRKVHYHYAGHRNIWGGQFCFLWMTSGWVSY